MTPEKKNLYIFSRRQRNLNNGRQIISDWLYQNIVNGKQMGDLSPTVGGRTIYITPNLNDTIYWMTDDGAKPDSFLGYNGGYMPIPLGTKDLNKAKLNFYKIVPWTTTYNNDTTSINARNKALQGFKKGGEMNKFQQGGKAKLSSLNDAVMQFVQAIAQTLLADPQLIVAAAQANPEALKSAVQVYQQTQDIQQAAQTFAQAVLQLTLAAKHGAKLNYLKSLKNKCAEDEELYYFKKGGKAECGCKKKEDGGKVEDKKESVVSKFKKACGGSKMKFRTGGLTPKQNPKINPNDTVMVKGKPFVLTNSDGTSVNPKLKYPLYKGKVEEEDRKKAKAGDQDAKKRLDKRDTMEGDKKGGVLKKSCGSKMPKEKCGAVMKFKNRKK